MEEFLSKLSTISDNAKTEIVKELTLEELTNIVKFCPNGKSATVIPPNVEGVPDVTELRPITLLCCDYRIMSKAINDRLNPVMGEVVESSQLATGEKDKNILTGAYDIIASIDYVNKNKKPAFIASYDMVKALLLIGQKQVLVWDKLNHSITYNCHNIPH